MPECLLLAYHQNLDRLRAEQAYDHVQAALVPHLAKDGRASYFRQLKRRMARTGAGLPESVTTPAPNIFTINGTPANKDTLRRWLATTFGVAAPERTESGDRRRSGGLLLRRRAQRRAG